MPQPLTWNSNLVWNAPGAVWNGFVVQPKHIMTNDNKVSAALSAQDMTDILAAFATIKAKLPFLINLSPEEKRRMPNISTERGFASFGTRWRSTTVTGAAPETLVGKQVIVATGSNARALPGVAFDEENILSNDGALRIGAVPKKLGVIGSGVIGLEMGSVWRRLGAEVTVLEGLPTFLGAVDEQIAKEAKKAFDKQGLKIELGVKIGDIKTGKKGVSVAYTNAKGEAVALDVDKLIVSIGRVPNTIGLNAEAVGLQLDERGAIVVDGDCKTNLPGVWAVGDVVRGPMLAHKAEEEGVAVAERIAGQHGHVNFDTIPWVIYTSPEIAWVGKTEQQLKSEGVEYKAGQFPFMANGRARALGDTTGFVKIRHYGLFAGSNVKTKLVRAQRLLTHPRATPSPAVEALPLAQPSLSPAAQAEALHPGLVAEVLRLTGQDLTRCPQCRQGLLRRVSIGAPVQRRSSGALVSRPLSAGTMTDSS